jgi:8-oxo-dGTP diphosphatase
MVISNAAAHGIEDWIQALAGRALEERMLVQIREKGANRQQVQHLLSRALARAEPFGSRVVVNSDSGSFPQGGGVHLTSRALMAANARPEASLVGASCHDAAELDQAERLRVDYVVLGPVNETASHPGAAVLGWKRFAELARERPMPIYAIGGLARADMAEARRNGAHGVALLGAAFAD